MRKIAKMVFSLALALTMLTGISMKAEAVAYYIEGYTVFCTLTGKSTASATASTRFEAIPPFNPGVSASVTATFKNSSGTKKTVTISKGGTRSIEAKASRPASDYTVSSANSTHWMYGYSTSKSVKLSY